MASINRIVGRGTIALALVVILIQAYTVVSGYGLLWLKRTWRLRDHSAEARSAEYLMGRKAADFLAFIEDNVPSSSAVSVPLGSGTYLSMQNVLQFYLMPRSIPSCPCDTKAIDAPSEDCVQCLASANAWVPAIGVFPPDRELSRQKRFIPYEGAGNVFYRGVYAPRDTGTVSEPPGPIRPMPIGLAIIIDAGILLMIVVIGISLGALIRGQIGWIEAASLGFPLGLGTWSLTTFVLSWAGLPLSRTAVILILLGLVLLTQILFRLVPENRGLLPVVQSLRGATINLRASRAPSIIVWSLILFFLGLATVISIGRAYSLFDAIANWALKGYGIALEGSIRAGASWGGHGLAYPQNLHLAIALFRLADGDVLPGSKLLDPLFAFSLLVGCFWFWRQGGLTSTGSSLGALLLLTVPTIFIHATIGYANLPFTVYLVLGALWSVYGIVQDQPRGLVLGGVLLGFAAWTRPEGVHYSLVLLTVVVASGLLARRSLPRLRHLVGFGPLLLIAAIWLSFGWSYLSTDVMRLPGEFAAAQGPGGFDLAPLYLTLGYARDSILTIGTWGLLFPLSILLLMVAALRWRAVRSPLTLPMLCLSLAATALPIAVLYVAYFSWGDVLWDAFDRAFLPSAVLLFTTAWMFAGPRTPFPALVEGPGYDS